MTMYLGNSWLYLCAAVFTIVYTFPHYSFEKDFPELSGPYLGQKIPGLKPEPFASGLLSTPDQVEINSVFSNDGTEFYYVTRNRDEERYNLMYTKIVDGFWIKPQSLLLAGKYSVADVALSPDGNRLYFCSDMPTHWSDAEGFDIWYVERTDKGWSSKPVNAGKHINTPGGETQPSFTTDGTMYFPSWNKRTESESVDLFYSEFSNGQFTAAQQLPDTVNSQYNEGNSFVAPDGSYILFARWGMPKTIDGGKGLYISFKNPDGSWTKAKNTLPVFGIYGSLAALSPNGKYLFISTYEGIHWFDVKLVEKLR